MTGRRFRPLRRPGLLALSLGLVALAGLAAGLALWAVPPGEPAPPARAAPGAAPQPPRGLVMRERPVPVPEFGFTDAEGRPLGPADFRGRIVLLNIWATWCVPCREEMPALDRLQAELGSPDFEVVALSIDRGGADAVRAFYEQIGIANLAVFLDRPNASSRALGVVGIPTTLLIDRDGREIGRAIGPLEWDSPETVGVIRRAMAAAPSRS
ncbi:TlpA family protein disulfide reductase [Roseicella aerolata]|uniref:TlpA family protein disulfide reductase n=1 Tax=Roseicella aerolata TaxID=2883479 RepID=A0A9X1IGQ8_9PROT|nr:TlpA family protein disulfide reductase [Roseicella aerolata]